MQSIITSKPPSPPLHNMITYAHRLTFTTSMVIWTLCFFLSTSLLIYKVSFNFYRLKNNQ